MAASMVTTFTLLLILFLFLSLATTTHIGGTTPFFMTQKRIAGPGSWPPTCRSKCGRCGPCEPVHVPVQPGMSIPLEYYPEAWRCKCGNKLFIP